MSRCSSLYHALANASVSSSGWSSQRRVIVGVDRVHRIEMSVTSIVGVAPRPVERIGNGARARAVLRVELPGTRRALGQLPLVAVQGLQEAVVPLGRGGRPDDLEAAGDRVLADAGAERALPAEALELEGAALGFGTDEVGRRPRRGSCRRCGRRRSARRSPRRSSPSGRTSRGCRLAAASGSGLPSGPSGLT